MGDVEPTESTDRLGGLFEGREEYAPPPSDGKRVALSEGLVVVDTNVLLHLYRFGPEARDELLTVLELLGDRLFIPAQVASEFVRLRLGVAMEMRNELQQGADRAGNILQELAAELKGLGRHRGLSQQQQQKLTRVLERAEKSVRTLLDEAAQDRAWAESPSTPDPLLPKITELLDGKVGKAYREARAKELREEADKRLRAKIPPGWKDADKDDAAGDYLLWRQTLDEAAERRLSIFLVTDDVKEDWYLRVRGRIVGPQPELLREARDEAGADLYMSAVAGFLELAREALAATVSQGTIEEAAQPSPSPDYNELARQANLNVATKEALRVLADSGVAQAQIDASEWRRALQGMDRSSALDQALRVLADSGVAQAQIDASEWRRALQGMGRSSALDQALRSVWSASQWKPASERPKPEDDSGDSGADEGR